MTILITGGAGFIGSHLADELLKQGKKVISIDNFDSFYPRSFKEQNIAHQKTNPNFSFYEADICNNNDLENIFNKHDIDIIVHLAARAGVRPSIKDPLVYEETNVMGTLHLLKMAVAKKINKFILASSSSVYGINKNIPWSENDTDLKPISPYAASKIAAENHAKVFSHLYNLPVIALRFFTVYGPRQRPDLAIHKFFKLIYNNESIPFYGDGSTSRDYTYISDIVQGISGAINRKVINSNYEVYNLGNSSPVTLNELITAIASVTGKEVILDKLPPQEGDVNVTYSKIDKAKMELNYNPKTTFIEGLKLFNDWFKSTYSC